MRMLQKMHKRIQGLCRGLVYATLAKSVSPAPCAKGKSSKPVNMMGYTARNADLRLNWNGNQRHATIKKPHAMSTPAMDVVFTAI